MIGVTRTGDIERVQLFSEASAVSNPAFVITPSRYVTSLITEHGLCKPNHDGMQFLKSILNSPLAAKS
jgi:methylthioribose-1-phosphate isomerase